ncbi:MAG: sugar phosphate isomerase/epimerase family protein [Planctomycetota bacterium]|nr:sugar phosphate isomerase/epimerase family protein [Planctomycetota bacterium]
MSNNSAGISRREMILGSAAGVLAGSTLTGMCAQGADTTNTHGGDSKPTRSPETFSFCFNTATILGQKLPLDKEVDVASAAGYDGIEPWIRNIRKYHDSGGSLADMKKMIADRGLTVESAIGFARWITPDKAARRAGLEQARQDMELVRAIGGRRIAAPPAGAKADGGYGLLEIAAWYRDLLNVGREMGVTPQLETWGTSKLLSRLGQAAFVVTEAAHPDACLLLDVYHTYKGGSDFAGMRMLNGTAMHVYHLNDYPADPPRETINDSHRVYPGDGIAPIKSILSDMKAAGFRGALSLEVFNREYWKQDPLLVAKTGLKKMRALADVVDGEDK